jgi:hypothetical protein
MELHLEIVGWLMIALSLIHIGFPRYFQWREELARLSLINKQMMMVHTFFLALFLMLMGLLCVVYAEQIADTLLGKRISFGMCLFWLIRLIFQVFVYSRDLWRGKTFETTMHVIFLVVWTYFTIVFGITAL